MTDLFSTALFGFPDSAKDFDESVKFLSNVYKSGITTCVLTPPCTLHRKGDTERFLEIRNKNFEQIKNQNLNGLPNVLLGARVVMDHDLSLHDKIDKLCIGNGKYLLVKLPDFARINDFDEWIYNLNMKGIIPIVANLDKLKLKKDLIDNLTSVKVYYQVSASTINSLLKRKLVKKLISSKKKFFISSDTHNFSSTIFNIDGTLEKAKKYFPKNFSSFFINDFNFFI